MKRIHLFALALSVVIVIGSPPPLAAKDGDAPAPNEPIVSQLLGWWALDTDRMLDAMKRMAMKENGGKELGKEEMVELARTVDEMSRKVILEFRPNGVARAHEPDETDDAKYEITDADPAVGTFTMDFTPEGEATDRARGKIEGDRFMLAMEGGDFELHLKRMTEATARERLAELKKQGKGENE